MPSRSLSARPYTEFPYVAGRFFGVLISRILLNGPKLGELEFWKTPTVKVIFSGLFSRVWLSHVRVSYR